MTTPEQWERTVTVLGGQLVEALKPVAAKLGVAADHLYFVLTKQSIADAAANLAGWSLFSLFIIYLGFRLRKTGYEKVFSSDNDSAIVGGWLIQAFGVMILSIAIGYNMSSLLNPEYFAIKTLLDAATQKVCNK